MRTNIIIQGILVKQSSTAGYSSRDLCASIVKYYPSSRILWTAWTWENPDPYLSLMESFSALQIYFIDDPGSIMMDGKSYNISRIVKSVCNSLSYCDTDALVLKLRSDMALNCALPVLDKYWVGRYYSPILLSARSKNVYQNGLSDCIHFGQFARMKKVWEGVDFKESFVFPEQLIGNSIIRVFNIKSMKSLYEFLYFPGEEDIYYKYPPRFLRRSYMTFEFHKTVKYIDLRLSYVKIIGFVLWVIRRMLGRTY